MNIGKIRELIKLMTQTDVLEIEMKSQDETIRIVRHIQEPQQGAHHTESAAHEATTQVTQVVHRPEVATTPSVVDGHAVTSPMVGTVYLASAPGEKNFVAVGQKIRAGETLCLIEAMKMFNKIEADRSGIVRACRIDNLEPVEYGQVLFVIDVE